MKIRINQILRIVGLRAPVNNNKVNGGIIHRITKVLKEGLEIWKCLVVEEDYFTMFFTIIILGVPLMFPLILGISYLMTCLIPSVVISISISWLDYLYALSLCTLIWAVVMALRILIKWGWGI